MSLDEEVSVKFLKSHTSALLEVYAFQVLFISALFVCMVMYFIFFRFLPVSILEQDKGMEIDKLGAGILG